MWRAFITVTVCVGLALGQVDVPDFDNYYQGYELIFHDSHNLLLVIHGDSCYFTTAPDNMENYLVNSELSYLHLSRLQYTESSLIGHIGRNSSGEVTSSTLDKVRSKYLDRLADYHCISKRIYQVDFFRTQQTSVRSGTGTSTGHYFSTQSCVGRRNGLYPYPPNCHMFIQCVNGQMFLEHCGQGTAFLASGYSCLLESQVPECHH